MGRAKAIGREIGFLLRYGENLASGIAAQWKSKVGIKSHLTLGEMVAKALEKTGRERCNLVGHSFGGLVSVVYALENPQKVANCITIGTPFYGTPAAYMGLAFLALGVLPTAARQITPNNEFLRRVVEYFAAYASCLPTQFHNFRSTDDELVPESSSRLKRLAPYAGNVEEKELSGEGHGSIMNCEMVYSKIRGTIESTRLPTLFVHGFAMDKAFFKKTLKRMQKESRMKELEGLVFPFSYDYTKPIEARIISEWYANNGPSEILSRDLADY